MEISTESLAGKLSISLETLDRWIRQGRIPVRKSGDRCIFQKEVLERWADKHDIALKFSETAEGDVFQSFDDALLSAVKQGGIVFGLEGETVGEVLRNAANCFPGLQEAEREVLFSTMLEREKLTSTGIGRGVAVPHPRNPLHTDRKPAVLTCLLKQPVDFKAIDGNPVTILFVIVCPTVKTHLSILAQLTYCIRDMSFIDLMHHLTSQDQFIKTVADYQARLDHVR